MSFIQSSAIIILTKLILTKQLNIPTNQPEKKQQHQKDSYLPTPPKNPVEWFAAANRATLGLLAR